MDVQFKKIADLPAGVSLAALVRPSIDWSGAPLLACSSDRGIERQAYSAALSQPSFRPYALSILRFDGVEWREVLEIETTIVLPHVQVIPGGGVLVAGTRSLRDPDGVAELNASVYDSTGSELRRVLFGDGVEDVQVTELGEVWVSYFDEGTMGDFGTYGWGRLSPERWVEPIGGSGLVRFDVEGVLQYEFAPPGKYPAAIDCYALNASTGGVWLCYHPGFPLVRVNRERVSGWRTGGIAADAVAVCGNRTLLHTSYGIHRGMCWAGRLGDDGATEIAPVDAPLPGGRRLESARWVLGRGSALHAVDRDGWYRLDLAAG